MTKVMANIDKKGNVYFDCLNHSGDHDACTIISTLCNVLIAECARQNIDFIADEDRVNIQIEYAGNETLAVFKDVITALDEACAQYPQAIKRY